MKLRRILSKIVPLLLIAAAAIPAAGDEHRVTTRLVCNAGHLEGGKRFVLGVLFEPEPGWHIYWRNPGEAGLATAVDFDLPDGFEAGEVQWPAPVTFEQPGGLAGYGYESPVVLAAEISVPEHPPASIPVVLTASWLACKDVCILGSETLTADLPQRGDELELSAAALRNWSETLPVQAEPEIFDVSVTGGPVPETGSAGLVVWLSWKSAPGTVEFFPDPGPGLKVDGVRTQTRGNLTRIDLTISRLKTTDVPADTLRSLVVTRKADGRRHATVARIAIAMQHKELI